MFGLLELVGGESCRGGQELMAETDAEYWPVLTHHAADLLHRPLAYLVNQILGNWLHNTVNKLPLFKGAVSRDFRTLFFSLIEPIWAPDKQAKMFFLKN